jgi:hypothetical protein
MDREGPQIRLKKDFGNKNVSIDAEFACKYKPWQTHHANTEKRAKSATVWKRITIAPSEKHISIQLPQTKSICKSSIPDFGPHAQLRG